jgi:hypothetical protein
VRVDAIGVGHNSALHLRDHRFRVDMVNVAMQCESKATAGRERPGPAICQACCYTTLADAFELDQGLTDEETIGQLSGILYEIDAHGRMEIEFQGEGSRVRGVIARPRRGANARPVQTAAGVWISLGARSSTPEIQRRGDRDGRASLQHGLKKIGDDDLC